MAGKNPNALETDSLALNQGVTYCDYAGHRQDSLFSREESTGLIDPCHGTLKQRTKVGSGLESFQTAFASPNPTLATTTILDRMRH